MFLILTGALTQGKCAKCDTIDVYYIYYNKTLLGKINEFEEGRVFILNRYLNKDDSITITYSGDPIGAPKLSIKDTIGTTLQQFKSLNTGFSRRLFSFAIYNLIPQFYSNSASTLLFYLEDTKLLFTLKLE